MSTTITAGNATNGLALSADNTGILELKTGTGAGTTAISISASQVVTGTAGNLMLISGIVNAGGTNPFPASLGPTVVDFTGIPSWVKRITVMLSGVSTSGTSNLQVQLGTGSTTYTTSGYLGSCGGGGNGSTLVAANFTAGFGLTTASTSTALMNGGLTISNINGNTWVAFGVTGRSDVTNTFMLGGSVPLSAVLTAVRITTVNGTDTFDAGSINILYE